MVSYFFAVFADVRALRGRLVVLLAYLAEHALVADHAHCEVVHGNSVVLSAHDLGSHVARSAARVFAIVRVPHPGNAEVSHAHVPFKCWRARALTSVVEN